MVKISEIDLPMIFKNRLLFSHGYHNNLNILPGEIIKSLESTNWADQRNRSLYFSHSERDAQKWIGRINNPHVINGELFGDLEIHDADLALKLGPGKAPIGVSAEIRWPPQFSDPTDFTYRGFAMVPNPEVPQTMVNFSKKSEDGFNSAKVHTPFTENSADFSDGIITSETARGSPVGEEPEEIVEEVEDKQEDFAEVTAMEDKRKKMGMSVSEFYAAPRDPPSSSALPVFDVAHVRNALARFNQTKFLSDSEKEKARKKIRSAAKKFGVDVSADFSETEKEEDSNLMSAERGLNIKMENNANEIVPEKEVKEDVKEEAVEAPVEEEVAEAPAEEAEESKEAEFSAINDRIDKLFAEVKALGDKVAKFSEEAEKSEEPEEIVEEVKEDAPEKSEEPEAPAEEAVEEVVEEESEEAIEEEAPAEEAKADFSEVLAEKIDKLADAIVKKEAAPMSTAEFGAAGNDDGNAVIDRLTDSLSK
jgi:hypothetical protein